MPSKPPLDPRHDVPLLDSTDGASTRSTSDDTPSDIAVASALRTARRARRARRAPQTRARRAMRWTLTGLVLVVLTVLMTAVLLSGPDAGIEVLRPRPELADAPTWIKPNLSLFFAGALALGGLLICGAGYITVLADTAHLRRVVAIFRWVVLALLVVMALAVVALFIALPSPPVLSVPSPGAVLSGVVL